MKLVFLFSGMMSFPCRHITVQRNHAITATNSCAMKAGDFIERTFTSMVSVQNHPLSKAQREFVVIGAQKPLF